MVIREDVVMFLDIFYLSKFLDRGGDVVEIFEEFFFYIR